MLLSQELGWSLTVWRNDKKERVELSFSRWARCYFMCIWEQILVRCELLCSRCIKKTKLQVVQKVLDGGSKMNPRPYSVHTLHHVPWFQLESREMMATGDSGSVVMSWKRFPKSCVKSHFQSKWTKNWVQDSQKDVGWCKWQSRVAPGGGGCSYRSPHEDGSYVRMTTGVPTHNLPARSHKTPQHGARNNTVF